MSWFKIVVTALMLAGLSACGFTPVYGVGGGGSTLHNRVLVDEPDTRLGYFLTRRIEDRLGRAGDPVYGLSVKITTEQKALAIDADGDIARYNLLGSVAFTLRDKTTGAIVSSGQVSSFTGYTATGTTVATLAAERDARERLMVILADQIVARLLATADLS